MIQWLRKAFYAWKRKRSGADALRPNVDIVALVSTYVRLEPSGHSFIPGYKGLCPFHNEKTPSFYVHRQYGFFHCFGCGAAGDAFKFIEKMEGVSFKEAVVIAKGRLFQ